MFVCVAWVCVGDCVRVGEFVCGLVFVSVAGWFVCVSGCVCVGVCMGGMCVPCSVVACLVAEV